MNLYQMFRELLQLNKAGDVSKDLRSRLFGPVLAAIAVLATFGSFFTSGIMSDFPAARPVQLFILVLLGLTWLLWKRDMVDLAGYILIWGLWFLSTLVVISEAGRASHWLVPQILFVVFARFMLNGRAAILLGIVTTLADFSTYRFNLNQYLPMDWRELAMGHDWVALAISFLFLVFIFYLVDFILRENLRVANLTEGRYRSLFEKTNDVVFLVSPDHRVLNVNQQAADLLGYEIDELIGKPYLELVAPEEKQKVKDNFSHLEKVGTSPFFERIMVRNDGSRCAVEFNANAIRDEHGKLLYYQGVGRDLTDRKRLEEQLRYSLEEMETLAMQDPLTGLLNRRAITDHAEAEWHRSARERRPMCLGLIDLDNLKEVNDSQGHQIGDQVITELGNVIRNSRRRYDWAGRWGGDEFMLVLPGANLVEAHEVAERLRAQFEESLLINGIPEKIRPHASIGVACYSGRLGEEVPLDQLIKQADQVLYQAKQHGKNRVELYRDEK